MKILVGEFITESNANIPQKCEISNYKMLFGDDCIQALHVADVFEQAGGGGCRCCGRDQKRYL